MGDGEMPAEVIYGPGDVHVRVSWGSGETVQVVSQAVASGEAGTDPTARTIAIVNEWLRAAEMPEIDITELRKRLDFEPHFDGYWAVLDNWGQCNRLIRVLKRARDRAFGSPE
jgi:hypothetical protein